MFQDQEVQENPARKGAIGEKSMEEKGRAKISMNKIQYFKRSEGTSVSFRTDGLSHLRSEN